MSKHNWSSQGILGWDWGGTLKDMVWLLDAMNPMLSYIIMICFYAIIDKYC